MAITWTQMASGSAGDGGVTAGTGWETIDVATDHGVPASAILLLSVANGDTINAVTLGARTPGSGLSRYITLHEAESSGAGVVTATFFVKVSSGGEIQVYSDSISTYRCMGYFEGVDFTEDFTDRTGTFSISPHWHTDESFGTASRVHQACCVNTVDGANYDIGVRATDSSRDRYVELDEAEPSGTNCYSTCVKTDSSGNIDQYLSAVSNIIYDLGYFDQTMDYTEYWTLDSGLQSDKNDGTWIDWDLSPTIGENAVIGDFVLSHQDSNDTQNCGCRTNGDSTTRYMALHEAEGGAFNAIQFIVNTDATGIVEAYCGDNSESAFYLMGVFSEAAEAGDNYTRSLVEAMPLVDILTRKPVQTYSRALMDVFPYMDVLTRKPAQTYSRAVMDVFPYMDALTRSYEAGAVAYSRTLTELMGYADKLSREQIYIYSQSLLDALPLIENMQRKASLTYTETFTAPMPFTDRLSHAEALTHLQELMEPAQLTESATRTATLTYTRAIMEVKELTEALTNASATATAEMLADPEVFTEALTTRTATANLRSIIEAMQLADIATPTPAQTYSRVISSALQIIDSMLHAEQLIHTLTFTETIQYIELLSQTSQIQAIYSRSMLEATVYVDEASMRSVHAYSRQMLEPIPYSETLEKAMQNVIWLQLYEPMQLIETVAQALPEEELTPAITHVQFKTRGVTP